MKIAVPVHNGFVNDHFGHAENYSVFSVSPDNRIIHSEIIQSNPGCGCRSDIAEVLATQGVTIILAGNIGAGAVRHLYTSGIEVVRGCSGNAESAAEAYLQGTITDNNQTCHQHEGCDEHQQH
jgi:predicted Fe-Mo cluster-binding NifX family protein